MNALIETFARVFEAFAAYMLQGPWTECAAHVQCAVQRKGIWMRAVRHDKHSMVVRRKFDQRVSS